MSILSKMEQGEVAPSEEIECGLVTVRDCFPSGLKRISGLEHLGDVAEISKLATIILIPIYKLSRQESKSQRAFF